MLHAQRCAVVVLYMQGVTITATRRQYDGGGYSQRRNQLHLQVDTHTTIPLPSQQSGTDLPMLLNALARAEVSDAPVLRAIASGKTRIKSGASWRPAPRSAASAHAVDLPALAVAALHEVGEALYARGTVARKKIAGATKAWTVAAAIVYYEERRNERQKMVPLPENDATTGL